MPAKVRKRYSGPHKALRKRLKPTVAAGRAVCVRCRKPIRPGEAWDLDHADSGNGWRGPAHRACNRRAGADLTNGKRWAQGSFPYLDAEGPFGPERWSKHWYGSEFDPRCRDCRELGSACEAATR